MSLCHYSVVHLKHLIVLPKQSLVKIGLKLNLNIWRISVSSLQQWAVWCGNFQQHFSWSFDVLYMYVIIRHYELLFVFLFQLKNLVLVCEKSFFVMLLRFQMSSKSFQNINHLTRNMKSKWTELVFAFLVRMKSVNLSQKQVVSTFARCTD